MSMLHRINPYGALITLAGMTLAAVSATDGTAVAVLYGAGVALFWPTAELIIVRDRNKRAAQVAVTEQRALAAQHAALARRADESHQFWYYCHELVPTLTDAQRRQLLDARKPKARITVAEVADGAPKVSFLPSVVEHDRRAIVRAVYGDDCPEDLLAPLWCDLSDRALEYRAERLAAEDRRRDARKASAGQDKVVSRLSREITELRAENEELRTELAKAVVALNLSASFGYLDPDPVRRVRR